MSIWNISSLRAKGKQDIVNQVPPLKAFSLQRNMAVHMVTSESKGQGYKFTAEKGTNVGEQQCIQLKSSP